MRNLRRKLLSQNFFHNRRLVSSLVGSAFIGKNDLILEIGPGDGIITRELLLVAGHVVAVELDGYWYNRLLNEFKNEERLTLYRGDFLSHALPKLPYKVFSNIPFAIEGKIIRRLIEAPNPPQDCFLVTMDKLANRLTARQSENMFSTMHKPWFDFSILHHFKPSDFSPTPSVGSVLFRFALKSRPLIPVSKRAQYQLFVRQAFEWTIN